MQEPYPSYLRQIKTYMAITNALIGKLLYIFLGSDVGIYFKEYLVTFGPNERNEILEKLEQGARRIETISGIALAPEYLPPEYKEPDV